MRQTDAAIKCNKPTRANTTIFYRSRGLGRPTASDTKRCGTPAQRNRNAPYSSPEIEEKSSGIRHCLA